MSVSETTGVAALARLLAGLGSPATTVNDFAAAEGIARSTAFDIAERLESAGFLVRDPGGLLAPGPEILALGFARYGLSRLQGPAVPLLIWLRNETGGVASLVVDRAGERFTLLRMGADWQNRASHTTTTIERDVRDIGGTKRAILLLALRPQASRAERLHAERLCERARLSLEHYLTPEAP